MRPDAEVVLEHPANAGLRRYRESLASPETRAFALPGDVPRPYESLGTHPDLVARLWDELGSALPEDCRAVFLGGPVLVHPRTGIVFGLACGTHTVALRLPGAERAEALRAGATRIARYAGGSTFDLDTVGAEWVFCGWYRDEAAWCRAAYAFAGTG